jgi:tRNA 5-methylaminomethyl-2-thiouridine biosynthesis bifunctional protein
MLVAHVEKPGVANAMPGSAVVIGAGIAGVSCAVALARRGIDVELLDSELQPGQGASGNPAALVRPFPGLDEGPRSRFSWSAFSYAARHYEQTAGDPRGWMKTGVLQLARDATHAAKQMSALERMPVPSDLCRLVTPEEGSELCGARVGGSGVWMGEAGWVSGSAAVTSILAAAEGVALHAGSLAEAIEQREERIVIRTHDGRVLEASCAILANGYQAADLLPGNPLALRPVRGQATFLPPRAPGLRAPVCQEGYVTPLVDGVHVVGATYDEQSGDLTRRPGDDVANVSRVRQMLPGAFAESEAVVGGWVGLRSVSRDRRPILGALSPGLYACLALGSRGFTWAPLAGELIASMIANDAWPLERSIADAISPRRFLAQLDANRNSTQRPRSGTGKARHKDA